MFKWPYPDRDWQFNRPYLDAMHITQKALTIFQVPESMWQAEHNEFFQWMWNETRPQQVTNG